MNLNGFVTGVIGGAVVGGSVGAAAGAAAGATGAAVLAAAGHEGYIPLEATQMGAIGTSILTGGCCAVRGALTSCGMFKADSTKKENSGFISGAVGYVGGVVLGGLTGYGVMNVASSTVMNLAETAASLAVGGAITMIPASVVTVCICFPLVAVAATACLANLRDDQHSPTFP